MYFDCNNSLFTILVSRVFGGCALVQVRRMNLIYGTTNNMIHHRSVHLALVTSLQKKIELTCVSKSASLKVEKENSDQLYKNVIMPCKCGQPPKKRQRVLHDAKFRTPEEAESNESRTQNTRRKPCLRGFANVEIEQLILKGLLK